MIDLRASTLLRVVSDGLLKTTADCRPTLSACVSALTAGSNSWQHFNPEYVQCMLCYLLDLYLSLAFYLSGKLCRQAVLYM